ncbi:hypothetical protein JZM24_15495 [Candidatus Sodalis endolongispinus]|uniref:Uncharacterized protein n=1 Tax=Candidatus Sodalis endolongispinus TaxID=2812662 RepID=A0ABS5YDY4_9GAMM|nr:hypothetical protein [Candidatus Sodalis endolongispinus]MBT9433168.1 hypothetical protein [Candidatus Sodalis endolongispinus]
MYIDAQKPTTEPYLIIKQGVQGTSLLIIDNIKDDNIQNKIIRNNGLQLITAMKSANARAFRFAPQEIGAYFFPGPYE